MLKDVLMHFDRVVKENLFILIISTIVMSSASLLISSSIILTFGYFIVMSFIFVFMTKKDVQKKIFLFILSFLAVYMLNIIFSLIDYVVLKYFFNLYKNTYLMDIKLNLCVLILFSLFFNSILEFSYFKYNYISNLNCKNKRLKIKNLLIQTLICSTMLILYFYLNAVPFKQVEIFTFALISKSFLAMLVPYFGAAYMKSCTSSYCADNYVRE